MKLDFGHNKSITVERSLGSVRLLANAGEGMYQSKVDITLSPTEARTLATAIIETAKEK